MVDGQFKIGAIIQARLGSTRLPNKVLMPLPIGSKSTIISTIINRLSPIKRLNDIVVATSTKTINDELEASESLQDVSCFRGQEDDVLSRFYHIVKEHKYDIVIRLTADNPIIDQVYLEEFIENFISKNLDYSYSKNLPLGCNFEIMKTSEIIKAHENSKTDYDKEHVTPYIKRTAKHIEYYDFSNYTGRSDIRLTIDYPSDYAFVQLLFTMLKDQVINLNSINELVNANEWLLDINKDNFQKINFESLDDEINEIETFLTKREFHRIHKILKDAR